MRILLISAILILGNLPAEAQDTAAENRPYDRYLMLYIEPLALLDGVDGQSFRAGMEYPLNRKWSVYATGGDYFLEGYILRAGIKKYFRHAGSARYSLSGEFINSWHLNRVTDYYTKDDNNGQGGIPDYSRPVSYLVEKKINAFTVILACDRIWGRRWVFEYYAGLGVKFKEAGISIPTSIENQLYNFNNSFIDGISYVPGQYVEPDIRLGIKLGWMFPMKTR
jgi:hypothetical protein